MAKKKKTKKKATKKAVTKKTAKKATKKKATKKATKKKATKKVKTTKKKASSTKKQAAKKAVKKTATKKSAKKSSASPAKAAKAAAHGPQMHIGSDVPDFSLHMNGGKTFKLSDYKGKKVVLYFYPKDMTPGCTIEGHDFSKKLEHFKAANTEVFGVSRDSVASHEKFVAKECYTVDLIADPDELACGIFGVVKDKNMYGKMVRGIERSTFIIDESGKLMKEWRKVNVEGHADEVLAAVK